MNEITFFLHIITVCSFALICLRLGKEALIAFIAIQAILANLFVLKQITLLGFTATASDVFIVGSVVGLNLLQEYFGKKEARLSIWVSFVMLAFYTIGSQIHLWYIPAAADFTQDHFSALLGYMPRIATASIAVYLLVQYLDTIIYGTLKRICNNRWLVARNYISIASSQLIDTIFFGFLGLYGIVDNLGQIMLISYGIKIVAILITGPFIAISKQVIE